MSSQPRYSLEQLHRETARIRWAELERHFARGVVIRVGAGLDLVEVATGFANDDSVQVETWLRNGQVGKLSLAGAKDWAARDPELWAVVTAPWVLVQERESCSNRW